MLKMRRVYAQDAKGQMIPLRDSQDRPIEVEGRVQYERAPFMEVLSSKPIHHFSSRFVLSGLQEGWLSIKQNHLHIHQPDGKPDVRYKIVRYPGKYVVDGQVAQIHYYDGERV